MVLLTPPQTPTSSTVRCPPGALPSGRLSRSGSPSYTSLSRKRARWDCDDDTSSSATLSEDISRPPQRVDIATQTADASTSTQSTHGLVSRLRTDLLSETKARAAAEDSLAHERAARKALEQDLAAQRYSLSLAQQQCAAVQAWSTQAASYYADAQRQTADERTKLQALLDEERADACRLQAQLREEKAERQRLVQMLEIETLGRARVEELLDAATRARADGERGREEACATRDVLLQRVAQLEARLDAEGCRCRGVEGELEVERKRGMRLASLLKQIKCERQAPFLVPAILDVFALVSGITDDVLEETPP